jgi:hypothetical protein
MSRAFNPMRGCAAPVLDEEVWSVPARLSGDELHAETGPNGRRPTRAPDDLEDDR